MKKKKYYLLTTIILSIFMLLPINANAASASIKVSSSNSTVVVGNNFKVTVRVSSAVALGTAEYTLSYDSSKVKYTGNSHVVLYPSNSSTKSYTKTFTFKAVGAGSSKITVKAAEVYSYSESSMGISTSSTTVKTLTQAQLEASYSSNNYLKSLSVNGYTLNPTFDKNINEYRVYLDSDVTSINVKATKADTKASVKGTGTFSVSEGDNKINVVVTSQKGTTRTYSIIASVVDKNPINVTIDGDTYSIVKRESILDMPDTYTKSEVTINEQKIPAFYSELTNYYLVGVKNKDGDIELVIYDEKNNTYTIYKEIKFESITFFPTKFNKPIDNYIKTELLINDIEVEGYKFSKNSKYTLIHGMNIETGKSGIYMYDEDDNTIQRYNNEETKLLKNELSTQNFIINALVIGMVVELLLIIIIISNNVKKRKKRKKEYEANKIHKNIDKKEVPKEKDTPKLDKTKKIETIKKENKDKKS